MDGSPCEWRLVASIRFRNSAADARTREWRIAALSWWVPASPGRHWRTTWPGAGRPVTLIDAGLPGSGVTRASFAWVGRPVASEVPSAPLRYLALDDYRRLETELPELSIRWSGSISWGGFDETPGLAQTDAVGALEPQLLDPPAVATYRPRRCGVRPGGGDRSPGLRRAEPRRAVARRDAGDRH